MSTTPNPLPGQQLTGIDSKDLETLIQQRVSEEYAKLAGEKQKLEGLPETSSGSVKLSVYGKDLEFASPEAASKAIEAALAQVRAEAQTETLQQLPQNVQGQSSQTTPNPQSSFSNEKFAEYIQENPLKGLEYALGHMVFGQEVPGAGKVIRSEMDAQRQMRQVLAAYQFSAANPQFAGSPKDVQVVENARQFLGLAPDNPESWQAAYAYAVSKGAIVPPQANTQQAPSSQGYTATPGGAGYKPITPPTLGRSGTPQTSNWMNQAEELSADQLQALIQKLSSGG